MHSNPAMMDKVAIKRTNMLTISLGNRTKIPLISYLQIRLFTLLYYKWIFNPEFRIICKYQYIYLQSQINKQLWLYIKNNYQLNI